MRSLMLDLIIGFFVRKLWGILRG